MQKARPLITRMTRTASHLWLDPRHQRNPRSKALAATDRRRFVAIGADSLRAFACLHVRSDGVLARPCRSCGPNQNRLWGFVGPLGQRGSTYRACASVARWPRAVAELT